MSISWYCSVYLFSHLTTTSLNHILITGIFVHLLQLLNNDCLIPWEVKISRHTLYLNITSSRSCFSDASLHVSRLHDTVGWLPACLSRCYKQDVPILRDFLSKRTLYHTAHPLRKFFAFDIFRLKVQRFIQNWSAEEFVLNPVHKRKLYYLNSVLVLSFHLTIRVPSVRYSVQTCSCRTGYISQTPYFPSLENAIFFSNETYEGQKAL